MMKLDVRYHVTILLVIDCKETQEDGLIDNFATKDRIKKTKHNYRDR